MNKILITGVAGFIGFHLSLKLLEKNNIVVGIDNISGFYPRSFYKARLDRLLKNKKFVFFKTDILDSRKLSTLIKKEKPDYLIHCAAKTGIIQSFNEPETYVKVNAIGTQSLLECVRCFSPKTKVILLSSSSVYGHQETVPLTEKLVLHPLSPYGFSKHMMELIAKMYFETYHLSITIIRPFSVYGPGGRMDMAPFLVIKAAVTNTVFTKYGQNENNQRDWTYIDDFVDGVIKMIECFDFSAFEVINFGNGKAIGIDDFLTIEKNTIKECLHKDLQIIAKPFRKEEMSITWANIDKAKRLIGYHPKTSFQVGIKACVKHYREENFFRHTDLSPET